MSKSSGFSTLHQITSGDDMSMPDIHDDDAFEAKLLPGAAVSGGQVGIP